MSDKPHVTFVRPSGCNTAVYVGDELLLYGRVGDYIVFQALGYECSDLHLKGDPTKDAPYGGGAEEQGEKT